MKDENNTNKPIRDVTSSLLDSFDLFKSPKDDAKATGGAKIISQLQASENEKDIQYVLKRLIRSLGANVPEVRCGYFATLVSLLNKFEAIDHAQIFKLVKDELHASGSSKSEVGDVALGQILVCGAVFRSALIMKCTEEQQKDVVQLLQTASNKKSYLGTVGCLILVDFINGLDEDQFSTIVWQNLKTSFKKDIKEHTLDSLYFLMMVHSKFPAKVKLRKLLGVPEVLCEENIDVICEKLMAGVDFNSLNHPLYVEISKQIAKSPLLHQFWAKIDSFITKHNRNRELVSINMLTTILQNLDDNTAVIPHLLSNNFFKLFMDWFKGLQTASKIRNKRDNEDDHKLMIKKEKELLNALAKALKLPSVDSKIRIETLKKLLFNPGEINFTEITGTTVVKSIIADLDIDGLKKMAKLCKKVLMNTSKKLVKENVERNWYNNERVKAAELISFLVSHEAAKDDTDFKITHMNILMCFGFFKIGGDENIAVSSELSGAIKHCFYRCFTSRFSNVDSLVKVLSSLCNFISNVLNKEKVRAKIEKQFPKENMECWELVMEVCLKIEKINNKSKVDNVFLILLYQLGLFLFSEPIHVKIARSSIKELRSCYDHYKKGIKKKNRDKSIQNDEPEWIEVMVEVLLSILSVESSVLRSVVQCVFRLLWEFLTPSSVGQIVSVLDPDSDINPLTEDSESEDDNKSESEDDEQDNDELKEKESKSEIEESDSDVEDEDEEMKTPEQLRLAIQKALGSAAAPDTDTESIDADTINEEEGKKLDEALAEAFRQFQQGKNKKTKAERKTKKTLSDFRIRTLDLIDIYLEKDPAMDVCLAMIAPLTRCLEFCIQDNQYSELENRIRKTIKNLTKVKKFSTTEGVNIVILCDYLKSNIDKGSRSHFMYQALGDVITQFATFIIHCSLKIEKKSSKSPKKKSDKGSLVDSFKESLQSYFQNRNCLLPIIFFHSVLQTEWQGSFELLPIIINNVFNMNVRQFRRNEGLELLIGFYRALNRYKPTSDIVLKTLSDAESNFENTLKLTFKNESNTEVKANFLATLKKLINIMKMFHESCHIPTSLDFSSLLEIVGSVKNVVKSKVVNQNMTNQVSTNVKKKKKKRKLVQSNGEVEPPGKKLRKDSKSE